jgi:2-polyprenyl-3-methyl-5-hydroxy-6-metoxy-1,4-benzoquinol methylase
LPFRACERCGFTFRVDDRADETVRGTYESGAYMDVRATEYTDTETLRHRRRDAQTRLEYLAPLATSGRILDVGAAGGAFVEQAAARGFDAEGLEPTPEFVAFAHDELGVTLHATTVENAGLEPGSWDVATMWHVLEHVPDPVEVLGQLREALRPGGIVAIEVPNAGGYLARRDGVEWTSLEPDVHVNQFGARSLRTALEAAGLQVVRLGSLTITEYLEPSARWRPGHVAHRLKAAVALRDPRARHPGGHELLRAIARKP